MAVTWTTPAGDLGILTERQVVNIPLAAASDSGEINYSIISGSLPIGLRLNQNVITGAPVEVTRFTITRFVVRADDGSDKKDRTFKLSIDGSDLPEWLTEEGFLNVGPEKAYFVLDNSPVDFQLEADDTDESAGDVLEYYLVPNSGTLPPGLTLSKSGRITGFTQPIFATVFDINPTGAYDTQAFDVMSFDIAELNSNGFDTYFYDNQTYDYTEPSRTPKKLSRIYSFSIAVTDGLNVVSQVFKIYIVTEDFLKSDNSLLQVDTNLFQADSGSARRPFWITDSYLGRWRANNYVTLYLDVYDPPSLSGTFAYFLVTNPGNYKLLSTGEIISGRYEISGIVPTFTILEKGVWSSEVEYGVGDVVSYRDTTGYVSKGNWNSTISYVVNDYVSYNGNLYRCTNGNVNKNPEVETTFWGKIVSKYYVCQRDCLDIKPTNNTYWNFNFDNTTKKFIPKYNEAWTSVLQETASELPPGLEIDTITGDIAGRVPYQAAVTKNYQFTVIAVNFPLELASINYELTGDWSSTQQYVVNDAVRFNGFIYICIEDHTNQFPTNTTYWELGVSTSERTFTVDIVGEIESAIEWISDNNLGTIKPNQASELFVEAESLIYGGRVVYDFISGELPPGLEFLSSGLIEGKVKQFADDDGDGLTRFYDQDSSLVDSTSSKTFTTTFDREETSFDRRFTFTIRARDYANVAEFDKTFYIDVTSVAIKTFANLYVKAFQSKERRLQWINFISDATIFKPSDLYRYGDPNFGIQSELKMLLFAGIESLEAVNYVQAMSRNHYRKQLLFGNVHLAKAKNPSTQETVYEAIYVDIVDSYEKDGKSISQTIELSDTIESKVLVSYDAIKIDSDIPLVSDSDHQRIFPNSVKNMRRRIRGVGERDREFLPLWMRSIQDENFVELGYTKALVLCYAKPGQGADIIARIKASGFDFKSMMFEADRYVIDIIDGQIEDKYLAFPQRGEKLP